MGADYTGFGEWNEMNFVTETRMTGYWTFPVLTDHKKESLVWLQFFEKKKKVFDNFIGIGAAKTALDLVVGNENIE